CRIDDIHHAGIFSIQDGLIETFLGIIQYLFFQRIAYQINIIRFVSMKEVYGTVFSFFYIGEDCICIHTLRKYGFKFLLLCMFEPIPLNLPPYSSKITQKLDKLFIFDELRKKDLVLTPEEWVRQHWVHYLHKHKGYPKSLMHIEVGLKLNTLRKRSDLLVFNNKGEKILRSEERR